MATDVGWVTERLVVHGKSVHCRRSTGGEGLPIVHIHGFAISGEYLMPTARTLTGRRVNVVPDLPGYGRSEGRDRVLDIPALAEALVTVLDDLDIDRAILIGNSMGCPVGLEVAHTAPERGAPARHGLAGGGCPQPATGSSGRPAGEGARLSPGHLTVALIRTGAHALNFSHPEELAGTVELWLDDALNEEARLPEGVHVVVPRGGTG